MSNELEIPENWTFQSNNIAENFDGHVREQLPWYDMVTRAIAHIARHYIPTNGVVYDIGASTGNIGTAIGPTIESRGAKLVAIDNSEEMAQHYRGPGSIAICDAMDYPYEEFDFAIAFLVVMFLPVAQRKAWLHSMQAKIKPGGALVVVDKCLPSSGYTSVILSRLALSSKLDAGVSGDDIVKKELSLAGYQRPINDKSLLPTRSIEFFRFGDFAGWIIPGPNEFNDVIHP